MRISEQKTFLSGWMSIIELDHGVGFAAAQVFEIIGESAQIDTVGNAVSALLRR